MDELEEVCAEVEARLARGGPDADRLRGEVLAVAEDIRVFLAQS